MEKNVLLLLIILKFIKEYTWCKDNRKKLVNESGLDKKKKTQAEFKAEQNKIIKLQTCDLSLFIYQSYFANDGAQLYLTLQPLYYNLKRLGDTEKLK